MALSLFEVHQPFPAPRSKVAPVVITPPDFKPGHGTGTNGANSPYKGDNYQQVTTDSRARSFRLVYQAADKSVRTDDANYPYPVVGMLVVKQGDSLGILQTYGRVAQVKGLKPGQRYFLGDSGRLIAPPFKQGQVHYVQQVGYGLDDGTFFLQPTGTVIERDTTTGDDGSADSVTVGSGTPDVTQAYPKENVYIDQDTGDWYEMPAGSDGASHFYIGHGAPSDAVTYKPMSVYVDQTTGGYYLAEDSGNKFVPIAAGEGAPTNGSVSQYRAIYIDEKTGSAYYADGG